MPSPRLVRYLGLAGSISLAVGARLGGAGFTRGHNLNLVRLYGGEHGVALPIFWTLGLALVVWAWWAGRRVVPSTRWALVTAALWALPLLPFAPLGSEDAYSYACQGWVQHWGGDPYHVTTNQLGCPWEMSVSPVWRDTTAPYGPLFLLLAGLTVTPGEHLVVTLAGLRLIALAGVALMAAAVPVLARRVGADPARATWIVLASPLVLIHFVSGMHNDALMVGLLAAGLAVAAGHNNAAGRQGPAAGRLSPAALLAAGALIGLAAGVKATAGVVLPFVVLAAVPTGTPLRRLWRPAALAGGGAVLALGALSLLSGLGLGWVNGLLRSGDTVEWTSPPTALGLTLSRLVSPFAQVDLVPAVRLVCTVLLLPLLVVLWWRARAASSPLQHAAYALAATVLLAPVFHPWYAVWPLAALAATWTGDEKILTRWVLAPAAVVSVLALSDGYNIALQTKTQGALLMTAGMVALSVWLIRRRTSAPEEIRAD
ncbi:polyprenol phosphomannose-dependent alpha 1,6 mannosyltransferase MptB [Actinoplanes sp. NPDC051343]|uniref:polyprenol phosphomannose-dependent alpha 1,6 mannosyltransferase MptB n=1 Tax=Actinoplanes sp. NPDC051343 TaxID=3363906 RepID=UPI0037B59243